MDERQAGEFRESRLWQSIGRLGVGAIPALPSNLEYLKEWLLAALRQGGWSMADRVIPHLAGERRRDWRQAAGEPVLVGVLRSLNAQQHFEWIAQAGIYYQPLTKTQRRQFYVKQIAIYTPSGHEQPSGIRHVADVANIEVLARSKIVTPWSSRRDRDESMIVYHLSNLRPLAKPITRRRGDNTTIRRSRWTTRLRLERARTIGEIALETEPEWKLLEMLRANNTDFTIQVTEARLPDRNNPKGRAWFQLTDDRRIRYDGSNGFLLRTAGQADRYCSLDQLLGGDQADE